MQGRPVVRVDCTGRGSPADVDSLDDLDSLDAPDRLEETR
jgi:hypothetical protein